MIIAKKRFYFIYTRIQAIIRTVPIISPLKTAYREFEERVGQITSPKGAKAEMVLNAIRVQLGSLGSDQNKFLIL